MSHKKQVRERQHEDLKRARLPKIIAFLIAVIAFAAFIFLDRKMAPPFPKNQTNAVSPFTNSTPSAPPK